MIRAIVVVAVLGSLAGVVGAAGPGAGEGRKVQGVDRDSVLVVNEGHGFRVRVPKGWREAERTGDALGYEWPHDLRDRRRGGHWHFMAAKLCRPEATLEEEVETNKKGWAETYKGYKLIREEKSELGGVPAWAIVFDREFDVVGAGGKAWVQKERSMTVICVNRGEAFFSDFNIDPGVVRCEGGGDEAGVGDV